ncbi:MAG: PEP-CTERM sorting domain-containing protein [Planctomycetales bacterium]|nr:PEP-CTERM sorting domain-containing protein [Planctomycetales bacterium]
MDAADYTVWKDNFGNSAVAVATNAVPEPASLVGLLTALGLLLATRRK